MKKRLFIIMTMLLFIPVFINGEENGFVLNCPSSVNAGKEFTCELIINTNDELTDYSINVTGDSNVSVISGNNFSFSSDGSSKSKVVKAKATATGQLKVTGSINGSSYSTNKSITVQANEITSIYVNGEAINFNKNTKEYNLSLASSNGQFKVTADATGDVTYASGISILKLEYGKKGTISVTCGNNTYKLNITRKDDRQNDISLKSLIVGDKEIELAKNVFEYEISVPNKTKKVKVEATATDKKAKIEGTKEYDLVVGENKLSVIVTAEDNTEQEYTILVTRKEVSAGSGKENLSKLTVNSVDIKKVLSKMYLNLPYDSDKLELEYDFLDEDSTLEYNENTNLKIGLNEVPITVIDSNDNKTKYTLIVFKEEEKNIVSNDEAEIIAALEDGDVVVKLNNKDDKVVSKKILKNLNGNKITYEVIGDNDVILYSISFAGKDFEEYNKDINFEIAFDTKQSILKNSNYFNIRFVNDTYLPAKATIKVFLKEKFKNKEALYLYSYDGSKELELLSDDLNKEDYYVSFKTKHFGELVLNNDEITIKKSYTLIIVIVVITIIVLSLLSFLIIRKLKKKKKIKKNNPKVVNDNNISIENNKEITNNLTIPEINNTQQDNIQTNYNDDDDDDFSHLLNNDK